ncbi:hypothetical protein [Sphingomonas sp. Ant20]|uniref:hypothetical protein n=1 Tax=Sphingomonas sp. Ant20 TaxID=104605 RepID=UPI0005391957|nr:hypothetical protein [Sphingomonas sp. Ant20]KHA63442.1 hypothetical protein NI18_16180 [Sphingomonas sp. Ant20]
MKVVTAAGAIELGTVETAPTIGVIDYSRRVTDEFGVTTVVQRGFARRMTVRLAVPFDDVDTIQRQLAELRATSRRGSPTIASAASPSAGSTKSSRSTMRPRRSAIAR